MTPIILPLKSKVDNRFFNPPRPAFSMLYTNNIHTKRLSLQPLAADELKQYAQAPSKWASLNGFACELLMFDEATAEAIQKDLLPCLIKSNSPFHTIWIIVEQATNTIVGSFCFHGEPCEGKVEIGYGINSTSRNQGFMTEALGGIIRWAATQTKIKRIIAETEIKNPPSIKVLQKAGFTRCKTEQSSALEIVRFQVNISSQNKSKSPQ